METGDGGDVGEILDADADATDYGLLQLPSHIWPTRKRRTANRHTHTQTRDRSAGSGPQWSGTVQRLYASVNTFAFLFQPGAGR